MKFATALIHAVSKAASKVETKVVQAATQVEAKVEQAAAKVDETLKAHHLSEADVTKALAEGAHAAILKSHFGDAYDDIVAAVKKVKSLGAGQSKRRVYMLPGIMASLLGEPKGSSNHVKWLDPTELAAGNLFKLSFDAKPILGTSVAPLLPSYLTLKLRLQLARHDVEIMHYDWRHKLEDLGKLLAEKIKADKAEKITLVAHSMGGLVARAALKDPAANKKVDLVVQLGTPNLGAPGLVQALRGSYPLVLNVASMDPHHTPDDYGRLLASFPGAFALMPPKGAGFGAEIRDAAVWPKKGVQISSALLSSCGMSQDSLFVPDSRFHLIVGANVETCTSIRKQGDDFVYDYGYDGDGTVPWKGSLMPGITKTYYADGVAHTSLCVDIGPSDAVADILAGKTPSLPTSMKVKKSGVTKSETDASLLKSNTPLKIEGDARHLFDAIHAKLAGAENSVHTAMTKAGSWLKKHF